VLKVTNVRFKTEAQRMREQVFKVQNSLQRSFEQMFFSLLSASGAFNKCSKGKSCPSEAIVI